MRYRVLLVGGGTAGHVEPALAVGRTLRKQDHLTSGAIQIECEFLGTKSGLERELVPSAGFKLHSIAKVPLPRKLNLSTVIWPFRFVFSILQSLALVKKFDLIIGFGGYVSAPAYIAGWILRVPVIIHEANAKPGWANNLGSRVAKISTVAFEGAQSAGGNWAGAKLVGMPIREEVRLVANLQKNEISELKSKICSELNLDSKAPVLLAFGGSLGSVSMNNALSGARNDLAKLGINLIQIVGKKNVLPPASKGFAPLTYASNMAELYAISDLVIARSGAVTCAELMVTGKFALLVPLAIGNGEQTANASALVRAGQAEICDNTHFTSEWLVSNISRLLSASQGREGKLNPFASGQAAEQQLVEMALSLLVGTK